MTDPAARLVPVGRISGVYGVRGWLRVRSETEPRGQILSYAPWLVGREGDWVEREVEAGRAHGEEVLVKLSGVDDREVARGLLGAEIAVPRTQFPRPDEDEFYWCDLIGLEVVDVREARLGEVERVMETGANDVLVVRGERERLVPFVMHRVVREVDLAGGRIVVDWDPNF